MRRCWMVCAALFACQIGAMHAADEDKEGLFNTFYLDGDKITYVLVLKSDRTFKLYGPKDRHVSGKFKASPEHLTLTAGEVKRYFHFDNRGDDLKLGPRENDEPTKDELLGEMPPRKGGLLRTVYLAEKNWKKKGLPVFTPPGEKEEKAATPDVSNIPKVPETRPAKTETEVAEKPVEKKPEPATAEKPPEKPVEKKPEPATAEKPPEKPVESAKAEALKDLDAKSLAGTYVHRANPFVSETLVLKDDASFSYKDSNGTTVTGTYEIKGAAVTLTSGEVIRAFNGKLDGTALILNRAEADNPKFKNDLASMSPTVLKEAKYERK